MELNWKELLNESENDTYTKSDFYKEVKELNLNNDLIVNEGIEENELFSDAGIGKKQFHNEIKKINYKRFINESEILDLINNMEFVDENNTNNFPQANSIQILIFTLNKIIVEEKFSDILPTGKEIARLYGFSDRQGNYYGDLLVYLGFLRKESIYYHPTELAIIYKKSNIEDRLFMIIKAFLSHKTFSDYYLLKKESDYREVTNQEYFAIIANDFLMKGYKESTISRRKSTVESVMKFIDNVTINQPKPFIKWIGGKRKVLPYLIENMPDDKSFTKYIEPFAGGAALMYNIQFESAIINDLNTELINTYIQVKENPLKLYEKLLTLENTKSDFYEIRKWDRDPLYNDKYSDIDKAARFIYLNKTCFNGIYRVNSNGYFNTPFGNYKNETYKNYELLKIDSKYFIDNNVEFMNYDFEFVLEYADSDTFVYMDPPYDPLSATSSFTSYTENGFSVEEQKRLKTVCDILTDKGVKIMISNHNTDFINSLFNKDDRYSIKEINVNRTIASNAQHRKKVSEVLIINY